ncbi:MAG: hypothetical protein HOP15_16595 [Planctomycetes bacterium]|nr:hypothetical protein [Planctomycetota bacterium]
MESKGSEVPLRRRGFISGVVLGRAGEPVQNATCSLLRGRAPLGLDSLIADPVESGRGASVETSVFSDASGRFQLEAPPGRWLLRVEATGSRRFEEDHLRAGDFRWVRLEPAAELFVRVLDGSGGPIRGARVELLFNEYSPSHLALAHAETGPGGSANLAVPSGSWWTLAVRHPDHRPHFEPLSIPSENARAERTILLSPGVRVFGSVSLMGTASPPAGTRVAFDSILCFKESMEVACAADGSFSTGHVFSVDQVLEVAAVAPGFGEVRKELDLAGSGAEATSEVEVHLSLERRDRSAHGRVVDSAGSPVARVSVFLKPLLSLPAETETEIPADLDRQAALEVQDAPQESYQAQWRCVTRSDENGSFRVEGLDDRRPYSLLLVSPRHANVRLWIEAADSPRDVDLGTVIVRAGGRIHGVVRTRDGSSVVGLTVSTIWLDRVTLRAGTTFKSQRPSALTGSFETTTNLDGQFVFEPLPEGEFFLMVAAQEFGPFSVHAGEDRGPEVLEIERDPRLDETRAAAISGRVVGSDGKPVEDCFVQLFRQASRAATPDLLAATLVDAEGEFELAAVPPGPYLFRAVDIADGFLEATLRFEEIADWHSEDIVLVPNPDRAPRLNGRVLGQSGEGLASMKVTLHVSPTVTACTCVSRTRTTDSAGTFDFGPLATGAHRITAVDPEGRFRPLDRFPVHPGDIIELVLEE